ncbi:hypothetical protein ES288_A08G049800v1 [Gossypium darwinii]|uniref:Uncharacterized protein n=1 Tax=Gossypium darwinii TaxID=34276 RepID=A0A5D2FGB2_GOSDA|nr:hypothetical protein ES288_A08G049800v1 [Gossypium darwinii]
MGRTGRENYPFKIFILKKNNLIKGFKKGKKKVPSFSVRASLACPKGCRSTNATFGGQRCREIGLSTPIQGCFLVVESRKSA